MSLDEDSGPRRRFSSHEAAAAWAALGARLERRRPLFVQVLDTIRDEVVPAVEAAIGSVHDAAEGGDPSLGDVDLALAIVTLVMVLAHDPSSKPPRHGSTHVADVVSWANDSATLGTVDLLVAELFGVLAILPQRWSILLTGAVSDMLAGETRDAIAGNPRRSMLEILGDLGNAVATRASRSQPCPG